MCYLTVTAVWDQILITELISFHQIANLLVDETRFNLWPIAIHV